ncbi:ABC transporter ATP-binding protein [Pradoshia sp. D12]|uniref:ABC transporter ATP-binding protein n=1 Tax=Bacillaceae TaxID=186817 RepID=UPI00112A64C6|nr:MULTISPECIES: ABC transporter ATP-binding protein [Bacillaceae]QFK72417.1 ABC transporter ATP-binding protein [Pradoshia sp. D12]TPF70839.1 ABC transporter ATP-binding protein [Bacillus sp. D12]
MANKSENGSKPSQPQMPKPGGRGHGHGAGRFAPVEKPKDFTGTLKRIWGFFGSEKRSLWIIFGFVVISSAISLFVPYWIGRTVDTIAMESVDLNLLHMMILILAVVYVTDGISSLLQGWMMVRVSQRVVQSLRSKLFHKLLKLPIGYFDSHAHGDMMSRVTNDIDNVSSSISQSTTQLMGGVITITGSFIMMLILSPILTVAACITIPFMYLLTKMIAKRTRVLFREQQKHLGKLNGHIEETISGTLIIKAFNRENQVVETFEEINGKLFESGRKAQIWSGYLMPLMNAINNLGLAAIAIVGGILAVNEAVTIGVIASFVSYSRQFTRPLNDLANIFNLFQSAVAGAERVFQVIDENEETKDGEHAVPLRHSEGNVTFKNVSFGYDANHPILKNISFEAKTGSHNALVGPTGAGKTTITNLLTRFYEVSEGSILIDGVDIRDYTRESLRDTFGIVLQDTYLFTGTIKENIKYGRLDATDEEMIEAARTANAHYFITRLPNGYDTMLLENGSNLSQGNKQLLAIARAILKDPAILILDEATSSVDTRTELAIQNAMRKVMRGRTSFVIAHRLSTIREADKIMVIDDGQVKESGTHEELLRHKGRYSEMYESQYKNIQTS